MWFRESKDNPIWVRWPWSMWEEVDAGNDHSTERWTSVLAEIAIRNSSVENLSDKGQCTVSCCLVSLLAIVVMVSLWYLYAVGFQKPSLTASQTCLSLENVTIPPEPPEGLAQAYVTVKIPAVHDAHLHADPPKVVLHAPGSEPREPLPVKLKLLNLTSSDGSIGLEITVDVPPRADGVIFDDALFDPLQYRERTVEIFFEWETKRLNLSVVPPEAIIVTTCQRVPGPGRSQR